MKIRQAGSTRVRVLWSLVGLGVLNLGVAFAWKTWDVRNSLLVEFDPAVIAARSESRAEEISKVTSVDALNVLLGHDEDEVEHGLKLRGASIRPQQRKHVRWSTEDGRHGPPQLTTDVSIVYVHGFSASGLEIEPVISNVADALGANVFFTRLRAHGLSDGEDFAKVRAQDWAVEMEEALAIGRKIGRDVIVIAMSTGAAIALENYDRHVLKADEADAKRDVNLFAKRARWKPRALILLSPNYDPLAKGTFLLTGRLGPTLARAVLGPYREFAADNPVHGERWTTKYRSEGLAAMMTAVESVRRMRLDQISTPVLTIYSKQDDVVDVGQIEVRAHEFKPPSKTVAWEIAKRHELVSQAFDADHVGELDDLILNWLQEFEIGTRKLERKTGEGR